MLQFSCETDCFIVMQENFRLTLLRGGCKQSVWYALGQASHSTRFLPVFLPQTMQFLSPVALFKHSKQYL